MYYRLLSITGRETWINDLKIKIRTIYRQLSIRHLYVHYDKNTIKKSGSFNNETRSQGYASLYLFNLPACHFVNAYLIYI